MGGELVSIASWWLCLELIGWAAWPLTATFFTGTASRGVAFVKHLGLLLTGYLLWLLASLGVLQNTRIAIVLTVAALGAVSLTLSRRGRLAALWRAQRRELLTAEVLFVVAFLAYLAFRAYDPAINHTEKPMDFGFLNAILRSERFPPNDMWLSGYAISYYYFGYLLMALLTRLSGVPSGIAYNLALGTVFALTVTGAYGLVRDMTAGLVRRRDSAAGLGLIGAMFVAVVGNLEGFLELLHANGIGGEGFWRTVGIEALAKAPTSPGWLPGADWWWWRATRLIQDVNPFGKMPEVIAEFPSFSFILGDLHPHVMALPFGLLALAIAWNLLRVAPGLPEGEPAATWGGHKLAWPAPPRLAVLIPLAIGALGFLNSWDLPTYAALVIAAYAIGRAWRYGRLTSAWAGESLGFGLFVLLGGIACYLPFYIGFRSQASGLETLFYAKTPVLHYALIFGLFLAVLVPWLIGQALATARVERRFSAVSAAALVTVLALPPMLTLIAGGPAEVLLSAIGSAVGGAWLAACLALLIALAAALLWVRLRPSVGSNDPGASFALLLVLAGLLLTFATEFVYIGDSFGTRMNTVFKFYYQAWVLLGIAAAYGVGRLLERLRREHRPRDLAWAGCITLLTVAALYYPLAAGASKTGLFAGRPTLDGTAWIDRQSGEGCALAWLAKEVEGSAVILEAPGDEYNAAHNRVSAWTGLPTVLGWAGHEAQWRGTYDEASRRLPDIAAIYQGVDPAEIDRLLAKYGVEYVYVGPNERQKYSIGPENLAAFDRIMQRVYEQDGVIIYRRYERQPSL